MRATIAASTTLARLRVPELMRVTANTGTSGMISSAIVSATTALVVEASTYWDADGTHWSAGTNVRGTPIP